MKTITAAFVLAFALTVFGVAAPNAEVYTWTDEKGVKHFSDRPPADAKGAKPAFPSYEYDETADKQRTETDSKKLKKIIKDVDEDHKKTEREEKLAQKIAELEAQPLEFFGSQRNKIRNIGYYKYRLEDLAKDPEKYFAEPTRFEGNVKTPEDEQEKP